MINNVLPGTYDITFESRNDYADGGNGGVNLVSSFVPGVNVGEGRVADVGTVALATALQLRGVVTDAVTGSTVANVPIAAIPAVHQAITRDTPHTVTDQNGTFVLTVLEPKLRSYDIFVPSR